MFVVGQPIEAMNQFLLHLGIQIGYNVNNGHSIELQV